MTKKMKLHVVGGGLAGSEAAWQAICQGISVTLHEMRPNVMTAAHQTGRLAELVCSNSLKSLLEDSAPGLLKREMTALNSLVIRAAYAAKVPAGNALAVDREVFADFIERALASSPLFERVNEEVTSIPSEEEMIANNERWIISSGPLTSQPLAAELMRLCGGEQRLYFYDAIAPVISTDSIDQSVGFRAGRYEDGEGDYLNLPMNKDQYEAFIDAVIGAEKMPLHDFEEATYFEGCLPVEVMVERGRETLRFGPMKPVGFTDPKTGHRPWAVVQLRLENNEGTMYSMVGFQTKMKWPEQARVFGLIPGLANAEYFRFGSIHRNTYVRSPEVLNPDFSFKSNSRVYLAGQVSGVEGYTDSAAIGLLAGRTASAAFKGEEFVLPPKGSIIGALGAYVAYGLKGPYQPMNANLGLLPGVQKERRQSKADRKAIQCSKSRAEFDQWLTERGIAIPPSSVKKSQSDQVASDLSVPDMVKAQIKEAPSFDSAPLA